MTSIISAYDKNFFLCRGKEMNNVLKELNKSYVPLSKESEINLNNYIRIKLISDFEIYTESKLLHELLSNKIIKLENILFHEEPKFHKVMDVVLSKFEKNSMMNVYSFNKTYKTKNSFQEQVLVKEPKLFTFYYKNKNIKIKNLDEKVIDKKIYHHEYVDKEYYNIKKVLLS